MSIQRYKETYDPDMRKDDTGDYVTYDDHAAELFRLTAENERLSKQLAEAKAVVEDAGKIMALLSKYGEDIVPHLMDTDDNPGERIRRALAAKEATNG